MLTVDLWDINFPSLGLFFLTFTVDFVRRESWPLSEVIPIDLEIIMWFLFPVSSMCHTAVTELCMLNHSHLPIIKSSCGGELVFLITLLCWGLNLGLPGKPSTIEPYPSPIIYGTFSECLCRVFILFCVERMLASENDCGPTAKLSVHDTKHRLQRSKQNHLLVKHNKQTPKHSWTWYQGRCLWDFIIEVYI